MDGGPELPLGVKLGAKGIGAFLSDMGKARGAVQAFTGAAGLVGPATGAFLGAVALGASVKMAVQFQSEMLKLTTLVGIHVDQVEEWTDEIKKLSVETGKAPAELARAMFTITSGGARGAEALELLEQSAKASALGLGDVAEIGRTATAVLQAFGSENLTASQAVDIMLATVREGNLAAEELAGSLGNTIGLAAAMGTTFQEVGAFVATYTRQGVSAAEATTGLRAFLSSLLRPTSEAREEFERLGVPVEYLRKVLAEDGLNAAMMELDSAVGDNVESLAKAVPNLRALAGFLGTVTTQSDGYRASLDGINASIGSTNAGFELYKDTAEATFNSFKSSVQTAGIAIGEALLPPLQLLIVGLTPLVQLLGWVVDGLDDIVRAAGDLTAAGFEKLFESFYDTTHDAIEGIDDLDERLRGLSIDVLTEELENARTYLRKLREEGPAGQGGFVSGDVTAAQQQQLERIAQLEAALGIARRAQADLNTETEEGGRTAAAAAAIDEDRAKKIEAVTERLQAQLNGLTMSERELFEAELESLGVLGTETGDYLLLLRQRIEAEEALAKRRHMAKAEDRETEARHQHKAELRREEARAEAALIEAREKRGAEFRERFYREEADRRARAVEATRQLVRDVEMVRFESEVRKAEQAVGTFADALNDSLFAAASRTEEFGEAFGNMVTRVLTELGRLAIANGLVQPIYDALVSAFSPRLAAPGAIDISGIGVEGFAGFGSPGLGPTKFGPPPAIPLPKSGAQQVIVRQTINFQPSFIDGASGDRFIQSRAGQIAGIVSDAAATSSAYAQSLSGR